MSKRCGFVCGGNILFSLSEDGRAISFLDASSNASLAGWKFAADTEMTSVCSFGQFVVAAGIASSAGDGESLTVQIFDANTGKCVSSSLMLDFVGEPSAVSVLQHGANFGWLLIAVGCEEGQCWILRQALDGKVASSELTRIVQLDEFFAVEALPVNTVAVAVRHMAAGIGVTMRIISFAWLAGQYLCVGYEEGVVLVHRVHAHGTVLTKHTTIETSKSAPFMMQFVGGDNPVRLLISRHENSLIELVHISMANSLVVGKVVASKHLLPMELLWMGSNEASGVVHLVLLDRERGSIVVSSSTRNLDNLELLAPRTLLNSGVPESPEAVYASMGADGSALVRVYAGGSGIVSIESSGARAELLRELSSAGAQALEPPLSLQLAKKIDSGFVGNDDEAAERVMELCAESGVLAPLRSALLSKISMAARSVHILQWTKKFVSSTLHKASGLFSSQSRNLTELESTLALLGTLYRLLEISEQDAVSADTSAALARVLAHAQQLEILVWLAGVPDLPQFPANEIAETSRARRRALGDQSLLIDMWYQQFVFGSSGSAGAASAAVWPPSSLYHLLALLTPQVSEASTASGVPAAILQALMVYALLDASAFSGENRFGEKMVTSLASHLQISAKSVDRVRAVWSVDRNLDASAAAHVLAAVGFNIGQDDSQIAFAAVKRLVLANHPHAALVLLRSLPSVVNLEQLDIAVASYLAADAFHEALLLCRSFSDDVSGFLVLLTRCDREKGSLAKLVRLPLLVNEENALFSFLGALAADGRECRDLLVVYLLLRGRNTEANSLWSRIRPLVRNPEQVKEMDAFIARAAVSIPNCLSSASSPLLMASLYSPPVFSVAAQRGAPEPPRPPSSFDFPEKMDIDGGGLSSFHSSTVLSTPVKSIRKK